METSASYLNTLSHKEAIAFVTSLQTVSDHLSRELEQMNQQMHQKALQLQGIQALLNEAIDVKSTTSDANSSTDRTVSPEAVAAAISELAALPASDSVNTKEMQEDISVSNGNLSPDPDPNPKNSNKGDRQTPPSSKTQPTRKSLSTSKPDTSPTKKPTRLTKLTKQPELRDMLLPKFRGNTLTDVVAQILGSAKQPLHLNDLLAEMYGTLPAQTREKAKISLANVLSTGKKEGKWQNLGDGMYAAKAVAAT